MKIAVLVSGGVDSSVALALLKNQGHDLTAFYIKIWLEEELSFLGSCPWEEDLKYVEAVCSKLEIPLQVVNLQEEYLNNVVSYTILEVKTGRTPSPDLFCNKRIKFGAFYEKFALDFDKIATGHYAILEQIDNKFVLKKAKDPIKDQTYFLAHLNQDQLSKIIFPIGDFLKSEVRALADKFDLPNKSRKDSQGICFLGKIKFSDFIKHHLGVNNGDLVEFETGKKIGEHEGFWYYTIGQRKGIKLSGGPWYVVSKDIKNNIVYISKNYFTSEKKRDNFYVSEFNWISGGVSVKQESNLQNLKLTVKVRHGEHFYNCIFNFLDKNSALVKLDEQDQGLAAGQFAVFYDGDVCLGCGLIMNYDL